MMKIFAFVQIVRVSLADAGLPKRKKIQLSELDHDLESEDSSTTSPELEELLKARHHLDIGCALKSSRAAAVKRNHGKHAPAFPSFDLRAKGDNGHEWTKCIERFENFLLACDDTADARKKRLTCIMSVEEVNDKFRSLSDCTPQAAASSTTQMLDYDAAKSKLSAHFAP
ncbi:hypothetical protein MRX96_015464 [Rhipicephalus microplus]